MNLARTKAAAEPERVGPVIKDFDRSLTRVDPDGSLIRQFNRFELKYLLTKEEAERVESAMGSYLVPDEHGDGKGDYPIESLYYDSPDRRCYWEKVEGLKFRRKLRIRRYGGCGPLLGTSPVFVEIKQRVDRVTQKRRMKLSYADSLELCSGSSAASGRAIDETIAAEIVVFADEYRLAPSCIISYTRRALIGTKYDSGLRVTFDSDLRFRTADLDLATTERGRRMLPPGSVVMEIKVNERVPYWLVELVAARNLRLARISKYCRGLDAAAEYQIGGARRRASQERTRT